MKKRGISLPFLVTILLAIIIFVPTFLFLSKAFSFSAQAKDSAEKISQKIIALAQEQPGTKKVDLIILDQDSALLGFTEGSPGFTLFMPARPGSQGEGDITVSTIHPSECEGESCLCLCRKIDYAESGMNIALTCEDRDCWKTKGVKLSACDFAVSVDGSTVTNNHAPEDQYAHQFKSIGGFFLMRKEINPEFYPFKFKSRRNSLILTVPEKGRVELCDV